MQTGTLPITIIMFVERAWMIFLKVCCMHAHAWNMYMMKKNHGGLDVTSHPGKAVVVAIIHLHGLSCGPIPSS